MVVVLKKYFKPEFINRIDEIIPFSPLSHESLVKIAEKILNDLKQRAKKLGVELIYDKEICEFIANKSKIRGFGARPVIRIVTSEIENKISAILISSSEKPNVLYLKIENENIKIITEKSNLFPVG